MAIMANPTAYTSVSILFIYLLTIYCQSYLERLQQVDLPVIELQSGNGQVCISLYL